MPHDATIDQMTDIDGFAAQIAALDAVVTISRTAAHVAGALGIPCIVVRDDKPILAWPVAGSKSLVSGDDHHPETGPGLDRRAR